MPIMKSYTSQRIAYAKSAVEGQSVFDTTTNDAIYEITNIATETDKGVSISYLEVTSAMYLPLLLDLTSDSIDWKKELLMNHVSHNPIKFKPSAIKKPKLFF